ncbi:DUF2946 family protein [Endozoicomonas lisbonensis]|uniref:Cobalt transporter n=1 Tax=Endozoicomonas lisbonensis TaxID=3120522 RepID=A0ABV2SJW7_9GAMM
MSLSIANILRRLQRHTAVIWLLMFLYITGASYATAHTHKTHSDTAENFHQELHQFVHSLELEGHSHDWDSDAHDCTACKFQFSHPAADATSTVATLKADTTLTTPELSYFSRKTPTKRLTRAPPVV